MTKIEAKETGPAAKRARRRSRRKADRSGVEVVGPDGNAVVKGVRDGNQSKSSLGKDSERSNADTASLSKDSTTSLTKLLPSANDNPEPDPTPKTAEGKSAETTNTSAPKPTFILPAIEPVTPLILPTSTSNLSTPSSPAPLSRNPSDHALPPSARDGMERSRPPTPAPTTKDRRSRFFPSFSSLTNWRGRSSKESDAPIPISETNFPVTQAQYDRLIKNCSSCQVPMGQKNPNTCSCGMDAQACSYETQKRASMKLKDVAKKAMAREREKEKEKEKKGEKGSESEEMVAVVDEEGTVHRPLSQVRAQAERRGSLSDGFDGCNGELEGKKEEQEWTVV